MECMYIHFGNKTQYGTSNTPNNIIILIWKMKYTINIEKTRMQYMANGLDCVF